MHRAHFALAALALAAVLPLAACDKDPYDTPVDPPPVRTGRDMDTSTAPDEAVEDAATVNERSVPPQRADLARPDPAGLPAEGPVTSPADRYEAAIEGCQNLPEEERGRCRDEAEALRQQSRENQDEGGQGEGAQEGGDAQDQSRS
ncbi:hypothetical protein [Coralloluteibacterium stylophorae]|uniref:Secreted protein n=1 Tax=Coralloluteibacterium stylophorae TaxID=1776034 RepID=A0A8J8AX67_9GAMM|nr:hypothetical protein [Coralloluteibacterium stylophorae]MBS7457974.1 hypothetical protein [Coralloluteibacterium stylophorae]